MDPGFQTVDVILGILTYRVFTRGMLRTAENQVRQGALVWMYRGRFKLGMDKLS
ncbi:hypothetical protein [Effusibacillus pohliae]|uniref:hypothetical protein n=1 Tax=Effusibacillus pohliae TaxID=232270 RepID=UPI000373F816|nr:hypothetical protein [Effusibacillus pohliae]